MQLMSDEYRKEQEELHKNPNYGVASISYAPIVSNLVNKLGITEILDYGAGKGNLAKHLTPNHEVAVKHYDPSRTDIPEWTELPDSAQMVCCIDVLEHIEPELLENVLDHLAELTEFFGFFTIHTGPAVKTLSDGRNAHLTQEPPEWWLPRIIARWELIQYQAQSNGFYVFVRPYK